MCVTYVLISRISKKRSMIATWAEDERCDIFVIVFNLRLDKLHLVAITCNDSMMKP